MNGTISYDEAMKRSEDLGSGRAIGRLIKEERDKKNISSESKISLPNSLKKNSNESVEETKKRERGGLLKNGVKSIKSSGLNIVSEIYDLYKNEKEDEKLSPYEKSRKYMRKQSSPFIGKGMMEYDSYLNDPKTYEI